MRERAMDGLRLIGLGRVPACAECPRYHDLVQAHAQGARAGLPLAAVPKSCPHPYCAPLARRYGKRVEAIWATPRRAVG